MSVDLTTWRQLTTFQDQHSYGELWVGCDTNLIDDPCMRTGD